MGQKKESQVLFVAVCLAGFTAFVASCLINECNNNSSWIWLGILVAVLSASCLATLVCVDMWHLRPADSHTMKTLISQYIAFTKLRIMAPFVRRSVDRRTKIPALETATKTLLHIIRSNQETEYGRRYRFSEIHSIEDFTRLHPITKDDHYRPMIERMKAGERNILYPGDTYFFASTSGTTGAAKVYPMRRGHIRNFRYGIEDFFMMNCVLPLMNLKRYFRFHTFSQEGKTSGGIPTGALTQFIYSFPEHNLIPVEYRKLNKEYQAYYAMALFALAEKELSHIDGFSPDLMHSFMKFTVKHWENICHDIETGTIGTAVEMPEEIRLSLSAHLQADQERAAYLREVAKHGPVGLAKRAWPDLAFVSLGKSAGFKMLATKLIKNHFDGVKVIGFCHGATEGLAGVNLEEDHKAGDTEEVFTFYPWHIFMEFIPLENVEEENPKVFQLHQLELGHCYEIVVTNENGLYRCRYGDVIKVIGFTNNIPKYEFIYRLGQRLNIAYERTPDKFLMEALARAVEESNVSSDISDFTTTESTVIEEITGDSTTGHYVFFIEFGDTLEPVSDLAKKIDQNLLESYELYKRYRDIESIADLEIIQVKPATMEAMKGVIMGAKVNPQFKMPRVIHMEAAIRHLLDNRMTI